MPRYSLDTCPKQETGQTNNKERQVGSHSETSQDFPGHREYCGGTGRCGRSPGKHRRGGCGRSGEDGGGIQACRARRRAGATGWSACRRSYGCRH